MIEDVDGLTCQFGPLLPVYLLQSYAMSVADSNTRPHTHAHSFSICQNTSNIVPVPNHSRSCN